MADPFSSGPYPYNVGTRSGANRVHIPFCPTGVMLTQTLPQDIFYAARFICPYNMSVDGLLIENTSAADNGEKVRLGIYNELAAGYPGSLLAAAAEITLTAAVGLREGAVASTALVGGTAYWLTMNTNAGTAWLCYDLTQPDGTANSRSGFAPWGAGVTAVATTSTGTAGNYIFRAFTYATLPDPWGTPTTGNSYCPVIGVREV